MGCAASSSSDVANEKTEEPVVEIERRLSQIEVAALGSEGSFRVVATRQRERKEGRKGKQTNIPSTNPMFIVTRT